MQLSEFDFHLPPELIAQTPAGRRDGSRLLQFDRATGAVTDRLFVEIVSLLGPGDVLVQNETRVIPARVHAVKDTGGEVELLFCRPAKERGDVRWLCMAKPVRRLKPGVPMALKPRPGPAPDAGAAATTPYTATFIEDAGGGFVIVETNAPVADVLPVCGEVPIPPYIRGGHSDARLDDERYQTVYAKHAGSVAAPTAGLHFTPEVLDALAASGVEIVRVTLHVGPGTFLPLRDETIENNRLLPEAYRVEGRALSALVRARLEGRRIVAVGTTSVRTLETLPDLRTLEGSSLLETGVGDDTTCFIYPGHRFVNVDGLVTNFHLPRSSLILLVSAFAGREAVLSAYAHAVRERYRFYSYGDAMILL
jgi:S-adenosylmethionine:tRNA ribosyltransferase-isomerase